MCLRVKIEKSGKEIWSSGTSDFETTKEELEKVIKHLKYAIEQAESELLCIEH